MGYTAEVPIHDEGHRQGGYIFDNTATADEGLNIVIIAVAAGFRIQFEGFHFWFRARTAGTLTGMRFRVFLGAVVIQDAELDVAASKYNADGMSGKLGVGANGDDILFRWDHVGGSPFPNFLGGIRAWGKEYKTA